MPNRNMVLLSVLFLPCSRTLPSVLLSLLPTGVHKRRCFCHSFLKGLFPVL